MLPFSAGGGFAASVAGCLSPLFSFSSLFLFRLLPLLFSFVDILSVVVSLSSLASLPSGEGSGAVVRRGWERWAWWLFRGFHFETSLRFGQIYF